MNVNDAVPHDYDASANVSGFNVHADYPLNGINVDVNRGRTSSIAGLVPTKSSSKQSKVNANIVNRGRASKPIMNADISQLRSRSTWNQRTSTILYPFDRSLEDMFGRP